MEPLLSGCFTVSDEQLFRFIARLADTEQIYVEPSAMAGVMGPVYLAGEEGKKYLEAESLADSAQNGIHVIWATGGNMVPPEDMQEYYNRGKSLL